MLARIEKAARITIPNRKRIENPEKLCKIQYIEVVHV